MYEKELRDHAKCSICGQKIGGGGPMFQSITVEQHVVDMRALNRQAGLEQMLGAAVALAQVMGPNEDMTKKLWTRKYSVCGMCIHRIEEVFQTEVETHGEDH